MTYKIEVYPEVRDQIQALPPELLKEFAEAVSMLELTPWNSKPLNEDNPNAAVRQISFGYNGAVLLTFLILELQRRVDVLAVMWLD
ncbi:hypothetical protein [Actinophytocola sediminis]